ncbi:MAG: hypothetical protein CFK52_06780 [Chloracidobacterium sp. CP2_5A]|nr:MAG: hypothetical protein CFK52_06780 [Chloracidobacterium sp. CP2_5A]
MPNEAAQLAKNFACADPNQRTFIGLPPSIKDAHGLPSATCIALTIEADDAARHLTAYVAGGRGGLLRLSTDLMDALRLAPNARATVRLLARDGDQPRLELRAAS